MQWIFDNNTPIYIQLVDKIKLCIVSGTYPPNKKLDSVRDLAQEAGVNPNTMQRALSELERENLVYTNRTSGKYVTEDTEMIYSVKAQLAREQIQTFLQNMKQMGYTNEEVIELLQSVIKEEV